MANCDELQAQIEQLEQLQYQIEQIERARQNQMASLIDAIMAKLAAYGLSLNDPGH